MKKIIALVLIITITASLMNGCDNSASKTTGKSELETGSSITSELKDKNELKLIESSQTLELYINGKTTEIAVKDKTSGKMWFSNPSERSSDLIAMQEAKNRLSSQIEIEYFDKADVSCGMNNYADSIELGQYDIEKIEKGIRITYTLGKVRKVFIAPKAISKKRFEDLILDKLDEKDKKELLKRYKLYTMDDLKSETFKKDMLEKYPGIAYGAVYVLSENLVEFVMDDIVKIIAKTGYAYEDMVADHEENKIAQDELPITFKIPVEYILEDDGLIARVLGNRIEYPKDVKLTNLKFLNFFGAAGKSDNGYLLVPDGSGAIIKLNNGKINTPPYSEKLYGCDLTKATEKEQAKTQQSYLNVYGIKTGKQSFISIIESGDSIATINADISGRLNEYNYVYPSFEMTQSMSMTVPYAEAKEMNIYEIKPFSDNLQLRFLFDGSEDTSYTKMANRYQKYLLDNGFLKKSENLKPQFYMDLLGAVDYKDAILGIPVKRILPLTTYNQAKTIVEKLSDNGIDCINVRYKAFSNNGINNTPMNRISFINTLGSKKDFKNLAEYTESKGGGMFADLEIQYIGNDKPFDGFKSVYDASKNLLGKVVSNPVYNVATGLKEDQRKTLSPSKYMEFAESVSNDLVSFTKNISLSSMGYDLYSDFNKSAPLSRQDSINKIKLTYEFMAKNGYNIMVDGANAYSLANAGHITNVPESSGKSYIIDEDIPFYQIILHGILPFASEALNLSSDYETSCLKMIEVGGNPYFSFMYSSNDALKKVKLGYHSLSYNEWLADAIDVYKKIKPLLEKTSTAKIISHNRMNSGISKTVYDNGLIVYVNFTSQKVDIEGLAIEGLDFAMTGGDAQ